ncbi:MAG: adenosylcobinamide-GDP ribazoletransferase [Granulosicoccus sp.]|jgi:adenosylcobinamide-GDP ribazoletransferase
MSDHSFGFSRESFREFTVPFLMALSLLTRFPVTRWLPETWADTLLGRSALWYPMVGLLLAGLLSFLVVLFSSSVSPFVVAVIVVIVWVALTGALHLDGLADCVDALYAGHAVVDEPSNTEFTSFKQQKIFCVLKDPSVGAMGAIALVLLLLLKVSIVASLGVQLTVGLLLAIVLSRACALLFISVTPYTPHASVNGVGLTLATHVPKSAAFGVIVLTSLAVLLILPFFIALILLVCQLALCIVWRSFWIKRLEGFVGDAVGALIELSEVSVLFVFYLLVV